MGFYFNRIYNPVYDFIVGQNAPYHRLQETCIEKLELVDSDRLLCAGVGTGNEILRILKMKPNVQIIGIDTSSTALHKAERKALKQGKKIETRLMDVQNIKLEDASFDKILCVHVIDFVPDYTKAVSEIMRVLKPGGKFAITFPSGREDFSFGVSVVGNAIREHIKAKKFGKVFLTMVSTLVATFVYFPFLFRKTRRYYKRNEIEELFLGISKGSLKLEDFPIYSDFIVYGGK
jgi:ubiquinone/menaquinone biosynthesis C-methylase UbiE